jgi:hypothetical protein
MITLTPVTLDGVVQAPGGPEEERMAGQPNRAEPLLAEPPTGRPTPPGDLPTRTNHTPSNWRAAGNSRPRKPKGRDEMQLSADIEAARRG